MTFTTLHIISEVKAFTARVRSRTKRIQEDNHKRVVIMKLPLTSVKLCVLLCVLATVTDCKRILLLSYQMRSHVSELQMIGESLFERGHQVYSIVTSSFPNFDNLQSSTNVTYLKWRTVEPDMFISFKEDDITEEWMEGYINMTFVEDLVLNVDPHFPSMAFCSNPLSDHDLFQQLKELHFDMAIVDAFVLSQCYYILPYRLNIPYVSMTTHYDNWLIRNPAPASFSPFPMGTGDYGYTEQMTFPQRLYNLYSQVTFTLFTTKAINVLSDDLVTRYAPEMPFRPLSTLARQSLLWLIDTDHVIDYPRPLMPNMVEVGGLTTKPAHLPLPFSLQQFLDGAEHGAILISFGSFGANLPRRITDRIMEAMKRIPYRVVWKFSHHPPENHPDNILFKSWIPQNDILGHPNVKLFITHCGANGQFEGLYHGVPMLAMPLFGDQPYNAKRAEYKGIGLRLHPLEFTVDELLSSIDMLINDPSYSTNINRLSKVFRSRRDTPCARAASWVEHVMEHGGEHMHSHAVDMPWYEYLMLDILGFLLTLVALVFCIAYCLCKCILRGSQTKLKKS